MKREFIAHRRKKDGESQALWAHLIEVSQIAGQLAQKIGLKEPGNLIGLVHDLGKASEEFDKYIKSGTGLIDPDADDYVDAVALRGKVDHSTAGAQIVYRAFSTKGVEGKIAAQILSLCLASHHSGVIDCLTPDGMDNYHGRMKKAEEKTHADEALSNFNDVERKKIDELLSSEVLIKQLVAKLKSLKESNDSKETLAFKHGLFLRFLFSCLIDADRLNTADFEFPNNTSLRNYGEYHPWQVLIERLDKKLKSFERRNHVDDVRKEVSEQCFAFSSKPKGLYQLTVPTGGGKTLASLRFALHHAKKHDMEGIFYIIPYTSIIDQNADEVRKFLEDKDDKGKYLDKVVLEHHSNLTPEEETRRQNLLSENWDAPIVFTTQVQFLETLFGGGTRNVRRMHQLANSVIIFDEVQTIPIRCVHMFNVALRFLVNDCGATAILCTATQPLLDKVEPTQRSLTILPEQRMMKNEKTLFKELKRVQVHDKRKVSGWSEEEVADLAVKELEEKGSVLIVVNTKKSAQSLYQKLKAQQSDTFHLSTNMCPAHRLSVLDEIRKRLDLENRKPTICVSTQLIEAGVDIDFSSVIRYLAGIDSIAQAAGRCNRNGLRELGNVFIVNPQDENIDRLEEIKIGAQIAERVLGEFNETPNRFDNDILSPLTMAQYYKYYFYDRKDKMDYRVTSKSIVGRDDALFCLLSNNTTSVQEYQRSNKNSLPPLPLRQSFQSAAKAFHAIDSATRGVVVPYGEVGKQIVTDLCAAFEVEKQFKLIKHAQRYSVNVYERVFRELGENRIIHEVQEGAGIFYLDAQYYSNEFGLSKEIVNEMESFIISR